MTIKSLARITLIASIGIGIGIGPTRIMASDVPDIILASGPLQEGRNAERHDIGGRAEEKLPEGLFHIGEFWMSVPPDSVFHHWLSTGAKRKAVISLTFNPGQFGDASNVRILSGTLIHETAPNPTPAGADVRGRLPDGNLLVTHILFLKDELTGSFGAVTFETSDFMTVRKIQDYDGTHVNIVIDIRREALK